MPFPAVYQYGPTGLEIVEPTVYFKNKKKFKFATLSQRLITNLIPKEENGKNRPVPFDTYCESMQETKEDCICEICHLYWPSKAAKNRHKMSHRQGVTIDTHDPNNGEILDEFEPEINPEDQESGPMPVFQDIKKHLISPFQLTDGFVSSDSDSE